WDVHRSDLGSGRFRARQRWARLLAHGRATRHLLQIRGDRQEPLATRFAAAAFARLQEIAEGQQIAPLVASILLAFPPLGGVSLLNRECPIARLLRFAAEQEATRPRFGSGPMEFGERHPVEVRYLLEADSRHQLVDVDKRSFLWGHESGERKPKVW